MRRVPGAPDRISLSLPASPTAVTLAENAARGLLQHRHANTGVIARLAAAGGELTAAGLSRCRPRDRLRIHYDVTETEITVTVEVRRRGRWQSRTPYRRSLTVTPGGVTAEPAPDG